VPERAKKRFEREMSEHRAKQAFGGIKRPRQAGGTARQRGSRVAGKTRQFGQNVPQCAAQNPRQIGAANELALLPNHDGSTWRSE
jgi:hypothetical protein